jgi:hypothetical protein
MAEVAVKSVKAQKSETGKKAPVSSKPKPELFQAVDSPVEQVLHLQRTIGNRAVTRLIRSGAIQAELTIGKPDDNYEKEADHMADLVMAMPDSAIRRLPKEGEKEEIQTKPLVDKVTPLVQRETLAAPGGTPLVTPSIESDINSVEGGGHPLSESTRSFFEPRFGADFSQVRIRDDSGVARIARSINAKAFTRGKNIAFNTGQYSPGTSEGKRLLAHELTHTLQQNSSKFLRRQPENEGKTAGKTTGKAEPSYVTEELKQKVAATILAESWEGQEEKIRWVYYNRVSDAKGEKGLEGSSAYSGKHAWYKIWLFMLGDNTYGKDSLSQKNINFKGFLTVKDFCEKNAYMKKIASKRAAKVKKLIDDMFKKPSENPYKGWIGQGNINDFNNVSQPKSLYWKKARAYYWLQVDKKVTEKYVDVLPAGSNTQFIFDAAAIKKYYDDAKHPLPKTVPLYSP